MKQLIDNYNGVYIINVFANMKFLMKIADVSQKIKIVNMFCICNSLKFRDTLLDNCLDGKDLFIEKDYRIKYSRKVKDFLAKKMSKEKENKE